MAAGSAQQRAAPLVTSHAACFALGAQFLEESAALFGRQGLQQRAARESAGDGPRPSDLPCEPHRLHHARRRPGAWPRSRNRRLGIRLPFALGPAEGLPCASRG